MLVSIDNFDGEGFTATTNGCGCCSIQYYTSDPKNDEEFKRDVIKELKQNLEIIEKSLDLMGMKMDDLMNA